MVLSVDSVNILVLKSIFTSFGSKDVLLGHFLCEKVYFKGVFNVKEYTFRAFFMQQGKI